MKAFEEKIGSSVSLKNILFATDFSAASEAALPFVAGLSRLYGSTVHIVHAVAKTNFVRPSAPDPEMVGTIYEDAYSDGQEEIQRLALRLMPFQHKTYVRHGEVKDVLAEIIRDQEIDLVVAGTHGRTGVGRLLMGSVAEQILRQVACPVLTVGPNAGLKGVRMEHEGVPSGKPKFGRILFATDFSEYSQAAAAYALSLAKEFHSRLTLLHVIESFGPNLHGHPGPIEAAYTRLAEVAQEMDWPRHQPEPLVEFGSPAEVILHTAGESHSGLIVLGARPLNGHAGSTTHLTGTIVHKVIAHAPCPVLTVRG